MYWEFPEGAQQQAVIFGEGGRWKAIRPALKQAPDRLELYDLVTDPAEAHDIAGEHPDVVARAAAIMRAEHQPSTAFPIAALD